MKKKVAVLSFALAAMGTLATPSMAFVSQSVSTVTATVTTGGAKVARFTLAIRDTSNPFGANQSALTWSGVDPLSTVWKMSDRCLVINSTVTDANGGIKIYTDNTATDASPRYIDPTPLDINDSDSRAAGLLRGTSGTTSATPLPMAWSIKGASRTVDAGTVDTGISASDPNTGPVTATRDNKFQWLFMTDESNWDGIDNNNDGDFVDSGESAPLALDAAFTKIINNVGVHFGQADTEFGAHPDGANAFVYFEANFTGSEVVQAYQTNTLRVEAFIE